MRMNKWLRRTVGTVGIAGGIWLLGSGTAHADASTPASDPQRLTGLLDSLFTPAGGPSNLGLTMGAPGERTDAGLLPLVPRTGRTLHALTSVGHVSDKVPALLHALPVTEVLPLPDLGGLAAPQESGIAGLPLVDGLGGLPLVGGAEGLPDGTDGGSVAGLTSLGSLPIDGAALPGALGVPGAADPLSAGSEVFSAGSGVADKVLPVFDSVTGG